MTLRAAIVIVSDRRARGEAEDATAPALRADLEAAGFAVEAVETVPDERARIAAALRDLAARVDLVTTSGGTGIGPRDVTPEATRDVLDREIPGLGEAMRAASRTKTPFADLSRALGGAAGRALVLNLPGSPRGARECLAAVLPALKHAHKVLSGGASDCAADSARAQQDRDAAPPRAPTGGPGRA